MLYRIRRQTRYNDKNGDRLVRCNEGALYQALIASSTGYSLQVLLDTSVQYPTAFVSESKAYITAHRLQPLVEPSAEDHEALANARAIPTLLQGAAAAASGAPVMDSTASALPEQSRARLLQLIRELAEILPGIAPGLLFTGALYLHLSFPEQLLGSSVCSVERVSAFNPSRVPYAYLRFE